MKHWLSAVALLLFAGVAHAQPANTTVSGCLNNAQAIAANQYGVIRCGADGSLSVSDTSVPTNGTGGFTGSLSVGVASAQLLAANATRAYRLVIKNESATASVAICLGTCTAALNTSGNMTIGPGQMLTLSDAAYVPGDAINAIASAATTPVTVWSR